MKSEQPLVEISFASVLASCFTVGNQCQWNLEDSCEGKCCVLIIFLLFPQLINSQEIWPEVALSGKKLYSANSDEDEITADPTMIFCIFITRKLR